MSRRSARARAGSAGLECPALRSARMWRDRVADAVVRCSLRARCRPDAKAHLQIPWRACAACECGPGRPQLAERKRFAMLALPPDGLLHLNVLRQVHGGALWHSAMPRPRTATRSRCPVAVASVRFDGTAARTSVASHVGTSSRRRELSSGLFLRTTRRHFIGSDA